MALLGTRLEAECGVAGEEEVVQPEPAHHDLAAVLVETRDKQAAIAAPHDRLPTEDRLAREQLTEHRDTLRLDGEEVSESEAVLESVLLLELGVDAVALDDVPCPFASYYRMVRRSYSAGPVASNSGCITPSFFIQSG